MIDFPIQEIQIVQESIVDSCKCTQEPFYQLSETDLSFFDSLKGLCSGSSSSAAPAGRVENIESSIIS